MKWNSGTLQAYLDGALDEQMHVNLQDTIHRDQGARIELEALQELGEYTEKCLDSLMPSEQAKVDVEQAWCRFQSLLEQPALVEQLEEKFSVDLSASEALTSTLVEGEMDEPEVELALPLEASQPLTRPNPPKNQPSWTTTLFKWLSVPVMAVAALAMVWGLQGDHEEGRFLTVSGQKSTLKGVPKGFHIQMYHICRAKGDRLHRCLTEQGQILTPGTLVQFTYQFPQNHHLMILSINEKGKIASYVPMKGNMSVLVRQGRGTLPAKSSLELDEHLGQERLFFLLAQAPFSRQRVEKALASAFSQSHRRLHELKALPGPWISKTLLFSKSAVQRD